MSDAAHARIQAVLDLHQPATTKHGVQVCIECGFYDDRPYPCKTVRLLTDEPVVITHNEDGTPVTRGHLSSRHGYIEDFGTDDELNLD